MSKQRLIDTCFWDDRYITGLDPSEKLLFLYLLTSPLTNICGVYQIEIRRIAFDTGFDLDTVKKMLSRFEKDNRCLYRDGWIAMKNWIKHQTSSPKVKQGIDAILMTVPKNLVDYVTGNNESSFVANRARKKGHISGAKRNTILARDNHRCTFCGKTARESILEIDHVVQLKDGGTDEIDNLRVLCQECNTARNGICTTSYLNLNPNLNKSNPNLNLNERGGPCADGPSKRPAAQTKDQRIREKKKLIREQARLLGVEKEIGKQETPDDPF